MPKHVMVDLETIGTAPGSIFPAIGAVIFDPAVGLLFDTFYCVVDIVDAQRHGLTIDAGTVRWWMNQSREARQLFAETPCWPLEAALQAFAQFVKGAAGVWGNGADFDNPILSAAYRKLGLPQPWGPYAGRCYRTLKSLRPDIPIVRQGTHHHALDDAISQAEHALRLLDAIDGPRHARPAAEFHGALK